MSATLTPEATPTDLTFMDREGRRWTLDNVRQFFVRDFYEATRREDGVRVVVHRTDFLRTQKG